MGSRNKEKQDKFCIGSQDVALSPSKTFYLIREAEPDMRLAQVRLEGGTDFISSGCNG